MQRYLTAALAGLLAGQTAALPADDERQSVREWDTLVTGLGYDYELYRIENADNWILSMFRITGKIGEESKVDPEKLPILLQHSAMMDAEMWLDAQPDDYKPIPMQLVDAGYDVWMANSRGTKYSKENSSYQYAENPAFITQYVVQNKQKYDYSFFDQGMVDLPAFMD